MKHQANGLLAAALAATVPLYAVRADEPRTRLAQSFGNEAMPGGVEARPSEHEANRSFKKRAPASEDSFESMKPPQADDAGSATMPAPSPTVPPKDDPHVTSPEPME